MGMIEDDQDQMDFGQPRGNKESRTMTFAEQNAVHSMQNPPLYMEEIASHNES